MLCDCEINERGTLLMEDSEFEDSDMEVDASDDFFRQCLLCRFCLDVEKAMTVVYFCVFQKIFIFQFSG